MDQQERGHDGSDHATNRCVFTATGGTVLATALGKQNRDQNQPIRFLGVDREFE